MRVLAWCVKDMLEKLFLFDRQQRGCWCFRFWIIRSMIMDWWWGLFIWWQSWTGCFALWWWGWRSYGFVCRSNAYNFSYWTSWSRRWLLSKNEHYHASIMFAIFGGERNFFVQKFVENGKLALFMLLEKEGCRTSGWSHLTAYSSCSFSINWRESPCLTIR